MHGCDKPRNGGYRKRWPCTVVPAMSCLKQSSEWHVIVPSVQAFTCRVTHVICYPFYLIAMQGRWWIRSGGRGIADSTARTLTPNSYSYYFYWKDRTPIGIQLFDKAWLLAQPELMQDWVSVDQTEENTLNCLKILPKPSELSYLMPC